MKPEIYISYMMSLKDKLPFYNVILLKYGDEKDKLNYELLVLAAYLTKINTLNLKMKSDDFLNMADRYSEFIEDKLPDNYCLYIKKLLKQISK